MPSTECDVDELPALPVPALDEAAVREAMRADTGASPPGEGPAANAVSAEQVYQKVRSLARAYHVLQTQRSAAHCYDAGPAPVTPPRRARSVSYSARRKKGETKENREWSELPDHMYWICKAKSAAEAAEAVTLRDKAQAQARAQARAQAAVAVAAANRD